MGSLSTDFESLYLKTGAQGFSAYNTAENKSSQVRSKSRAPGPEPLSAFPKKHTPFIVGKSTENAPPTGSDLSFKNRMARHRAFEKKPSNYERQQLAAAAIQRTITRFLTERRDKELKDKEDSDRARDRAARLKHSQERFRHLVRSGAQAVCTETGRIRSELISDVEPKESGTVIHAEKANFLFDTEFDLEADETGLLAFASGLNADEFEKNLEVRSLILL